MESKHELPIMSECFKLHSNRLYIGITKSKSSGSSIVPSLFWIHVINGAKFLNATQAAIFTAIVILPLNKMQASL